jgi:hypothetical protein
MDFFYFFIKFVTSYVFYDLGLQARRVLPGCIPLRYSTANGV